MKGVAVFCLYLILAGTVFGMGGNDSSKIDPESAGPVTLAFLPVLDALPFYIASERGYFSEENLEVRGIAVANPMERDQLMQSEEIDGMLNELSTLALFNRDSITLKALITARKPLGGSSGFRILASPGSGYKGPADLKNIPVGISLNTVIEYTTERLLEAGGLKPGEISFKNIPVIPERFQLLMSGTVKAATLPEPLASAALNSGAVEIMSDAMHPEFSVSVISFTAEFLENSPEAAAGFVKAWAKAVRDINTDPESCREILAAEIGIPDTVRDSFQIPLFPVNELPEESQWNDVTAWLSEKGMLESEPLYTDSMAEAFTDQP